MKRFVTLLMLLGLTGVAYAQAPGANIDTASAIKILEQQTMALMKYQHADFKDVELSKNSNPDGGASYFLCGGIRRPSAGGQRPLFQRFISFFTVEAGGKASDAATLWEHQSKTMQFQAQFNKQYDLVCRKK